MNAPSVTAYSKAMQHPEVAFSDKQLSVGIVQRRKSGQPQSYSGTFTATFRMQTGTGPLAIRCFVDDVADLRERYRVIERHLKHLRSPYLPPAEVRLGAISVEGDCYDIVTMDWVEGSHFDAFVSANLRNRATLRHLERSIVALSETLESLRVAHGDIQNGNVIVNAGELRLVDYDDLWLPELAKFGRSSGIGHIDFRHPKRCAEDYGPNLDRFAFISIALTLRALAYRPELWAEFEGGDQRLLFGRADYERPRSSPLLTKLLAMRELAPYIEEFIEICEGPATDVPAPSDFFGAPAIYSARLTSEEKSVWGRGVNSSEARLRIVQALRSLWRLENGPPAVAIAVALVFGIFLGRLIMAAVSVNDP